MELTHELKNQATSITATTNGFTIETNCHALIIDNNGQDDARIYFNEDNDNFYLLKAGTTLPIKTDNENEIIRDSIKIEFPSTQAPLVNIIKQTKSIIGQ